MHPTTHLMISWLVGQHLPDRRDRRLVTYAGLAPDLDGLTLLAGVDAYGRWHHVLTHGLVAAVGATVLCAALARDRLRVALLAWLAFHLHLLCDFFGSGVGWGITYWYPFSRVEYLSPIQWDLNSWQNVMATLLALLMSVWLAIRNGRTFAEAAMSENWDALVVETLQRRFGGGAERERA